MTEYTVEWSEDFKVNLEDAIDMGQADEISGLRRFPLYGGAICCRVAIDENAHIAKLIEKSEPEECVYLGIDWLKI